MSATARPLSGRIILTNLAVSATQVRRLAALEEEPFRRHALRDAVFEIDRLRSKLERIL